MFTAEERAAVRDRVLELARADGRVSGGALTGSSAVGKEDAWSDVDTSFGIVDGVEPLEVLEDWTRVLGPELDVVHHWDLHHGATIYRVYLLPSTLELDIAVTPAAEWVQRGPNFRLVFGESGFVEPDPPSLDERIGFGWLSALVTRMAIERGKPWQAVFFVNSLRDAAFALACIRHGERPEFARGTDALPADVKEPYDPTLPRSLEPDELRRALAAGTAALIREVREVRPELAQRLGTVLADVARG